MCSETLSTRELPQERRVGHNEHRLWFTLTAMPNLVINTNELFQHLPRAPIVEAVIDIRARPTAEFEEHTIKARLEGQLGDYQFLDSQREIQIEHAMNLEAGTQPGPIIRDLGWKGLRFQSHDGKYIVQYNRDGFVFSRLAPYQSWEQLFGEAMRLWREYLGLARPVEIHRIGLRYINRIQLSPDELRFEDYLNPAPVPPNGLDLPFHGFMHHDALAIPGHPYTINVIRTMQPPGGASVEGLGLILDIDVSTTQGTDLDEMLLEQRLLEMRWLKNKVFFGSITQNSLRLFL